MISQLIRIATRSSQLALWQANHVASLIRELSSTHETHEVELVHVTTTGDHNQSDTLRSFGGMGVFTREVQKALLDGRADLAVHSLKDLPTTSHPELMLAGVPLRASCWDALVLPVRSKVRNVLEDLNPTLISRGIRIGTGSLRRQAQLKYQRPDLQFQEIRGNVETRLRKLDENECDALILAVAGLERLNLEDRINFELRTPVMFPAVGQGALGLECRRNDDQTQRLLRSLTHTPTFQAVTAERTLLSELRAGCHAPLGVESHVDQEVLILKAVVLDAGGNERIEVTQNGKLSHPTELGKSCAKELLNLGAAELLNPDELA